MPFVRWFRVDTLFLAITWGGVNSLFFDINRNFHNAPSIRFEPIGGEPGRSHDNPVNEPARVEPGDRPFLAISGDQRPSNLFLFEPFYF